MRVRAEAQACPKHVSLKLMTALKGQQLKAQGWPRFLRPTLGKGFKLMSTLKGLCLEATLSGLMNHVIDPQGRPQKARPTLGSEPKPPSGAFWGRTYKVIRPMSYAKRYMQKTPACRTHLHYSKAYKLHPLG